MSKPTEKNVAEPTESTEPGTAPPETRLPVVSEDDSPEVVRDLLLLAGLEDAATTLVASWDKEQRRSAMDWAAASIALASDNTVEVPEVPPHVLLLRDAQRGATTDGDAGENAAGPLPEEQPEERATEPPVASSAGLSAAPGMRVCYSDRTADERGGWNVHARDALRSVGGAPYEYQVSWFNGRVGHPTRSGGVPLRFQTGSLAGGNGPNGLTNESLLAVVLDRLVAFQNGVCPCEENELAIEMIRDALELLQDRTKQRRASGVEGTQKAVGK